MLIQFWIAHGFVNSSNPDECLEIAGLRCFENLLWRSFFHDVGKDEFGNIISCKMHDCIHDLAAKVAGFESTIVHRVGLCIGDLTRHASIEIEIDLSQEIQITSPSSKRLRTLLLIGDWRLKWNEGAWQLICRDFWRLRVLDLHRLGIMEVSPLIEKFKHLKYLDLSNNKMKALPNSITNLINLQVLKLNGCRKLEKLARDINKLINLRNLDVGSSRDDDICGSLEYMPCGIGKLTCLQKLSCFVVAKSSPESKMVGGLDELNRLNELRGSLEIRILGYESNSCLLEFGGAKLIEKQYLQSLSIEWCLSEGASDSNTNDLYDNMLQGLQPNLNLQDLNVKGYGGTRIPSWLSHLTNLVRISLEHCTSCKHIPPLDEIPFLEELRVIAMDNLEYIDSEGVGGRVVSMFFPYLKKLGIGDCPNLKGWWKKSSDESTTTIYQEDLTMPCFPCLSSLIIDCCPDLTSMPLYPTLNEDLYLWNTSSVPLQQTLKMKGWKSPPPSASPSSSSFIRPLSKLKELYIHSIEDMESLPENGLQNLSSLQQLEIFHCGRLKSLPLPDHGMHSLQTLDVRYCHGLRSLSKTQSQRISNLPSLQLLYIRDCSEEFSGRLREGKEAVEYWPYINHIPNIIIDFSEIQMYGRYVRT